MGKIVIGIDPDSEAYGFAGYLDGKLVRLEEIQLPQLVDLLRDTIQIDEVLVSIEDVMINTFVYARNQKKSKRVQSKVGISIGRCQQSQVELTRMLDYYRIPYVLHKPQSGNWADKRELFERVTGWGKQSNADTRSAAFFGYLALRR